jgi:hypothetical protein
MRKTISLLFLIFILCGCSAPTATQAVALNWQVQVISHEVKDTLKTVETVTEYNGTKTDVTHVQSPSQGNVYLIINLAVNKVGSEAITFTWQDLAVQDGSGNAYHRVSNDTFLEQHNYKPRMTGLEIRLGQNQGWVCFEIPASAAGGKLTLVYSGAGSQQQISLQ